MIGVHDRKLAQYIADYIETELERGNTIERETIENAMDAFKGGAYDGNSYAIRVFPNA